MIFKPTVTIYMIKFLLSLATGERYIPHSNTILNSKYKLPNVEDVDMHLGYFGIGLTNDLNVNLPDLNSDYYKHSPKDADLFYPVPFKIEKVADRGPDTDYVNYRLRVRQTINGDDYYLYYLKTITELSSAPSILKITVDNDKKSISRFNEDDSTILTPIPRTFTNEELYDLSNYLAVTKKLRISLTNLEIEDIQKSIELLYPDAPIKEIGEIAVYIGGDNVTSSGLEASNVQAGYFFPVNNLLSNSDETGIVRNLEIGGIEGILI